MIDQAIREIELKRLRARLADLELASSTELSGREIDSMIWALADQTGMAQGGTDRSVRSDMTRVIERYPGSRGAAIAHQFLESNPQSFQ